MNRTSPISAPAGHRISGKSQLAMLASLLALLSLASTTTHAQSANIGADAQETIQGVVLNSVTNKPIARALVFSGDQRFAVLTDQEGRFEFRLPAPIQMSSDEVGSTIQGQRAFSSLAAANFAARKPGFLDFSQPRQQVSTDSAAIEVTLKLTPEAIVTGHVQLSTTDSPAGVQVQLLQKRIQDGRARWSPVNLYSTNSNGEFRISDLTPGDYKLMTREWVDRDPAENGAHQQHFGYPPVYYPGATDNASAGILHVKAGETIQADLPMSRQPYYPVRIEVLNATPVAFLNVAVNVGSVTSDKPANTGPSGFDLGYNARERRIQGELPNGTYLVHASNNSPAGSSGSVTVTVAGAAGAGPQLTLVPNQSIAVVIKEELTSAGPNGGIAFDRSQMGNQPIANVVLMPEDDSRGGAAGLRPPRTPEDKSLVIENVAPGRYLVQGYSLIGYVASITSGITDLRREPLVLGGSGASAPIEITVRNDFATLEGTVQGEAVEANDPASAPNVPSAYIYCIPAPGSPGRYMEMGTYQGGKFSAVNLVPGTYRLLAFAQPQQLEYENPEAMRAYESLGTVVTLAGGQTQQVELSKIQTAVSAERE